MMTCVIFSNAQNNLCSIHNLFCFNFINTSRKFRGGENRKTEIQKKGVGGGRISLFVLFYYNLQRWSKGVGVLGSPVVPRPPCLSLVRSTS